MTSDQEASSSNSFNSNSIRRTWKYDIFLSFRGEDTRKGFTDHLYRALDSSGFKVFRDDEELQRGEVISKQLLQAIEDSHFVIVVLSKNYASSSWCLNELQHILYSRDNLCQQVFPIFYDTDPSDVRHQRGSFAKAFATDQMLQRDNKVIESWKDSLNKVADLSGWDCKDRHEAELIETIVGELWTKLRYRLPPSNEDLVGIDYKVKQVEPLLKIGLNDVRFVGIWGLPGVGKTTIARVVFEKYRSQFDISCFLHNVRATSERDGDVHLQCQLLSHLKITSMEIKNTLDGKEVIQNRFGNIEVLLVLDDVSQASHLENLANSPNWFGAGSRVIITSRDSRLLRRGHAIYVHEVETMNADESLQLFCQKAFGRDEPQEDHLELSKIACDYAKGLPLALSVLGSFLRGRSVPEWKDALDMLKKDPHEDIFRILEISFDALTDTEKAIFLDIACFFNGRSKNDTTQILKSCGFNATIAITTLREKSMLKVYDHSLVMHDLLEQMGRKIVKDKSPTDVGHRSRLWSMEDIDEVMENNLGTEEIQGMVSSTSCEACWHPETFSKFPNLRLLMVSSSDFNLPNGLKCLSHALKVLHWKNYPLDTLPSSPRLYKLVDLKMRNSKLKKLWNNSLCSKNLKFLDLSFSKNLIETPDFSELANLEGLELEGCEGLVDLHGSIGQHKNLRVLNLKDCKKLRACCPKKLEMAALKEFVLCGCIQVKYLPEFGECMKNLETLDAGETNLVKLPESFGLLIGLETLKLRGCKNLVCLPQSIGKLKRLVLLDIAGCSKFGTLPENLNEIEGLEDLNASETDITEIPCSSGGLERPKKLSFGGCKRSTWNSWSLILPLKHMFWGHSIHKGLTLPASIFNLKSLKKLDLSYCNIDDGSIPGDFSGLSSLQELDLSGNKFKNLPAGCISNLLNLQSVYLNSCSELRSLPQAPPSLETMDAGKCASMETVSGELLLHVFTSIDRQAKRVWHWSDGQNLGLSISGSEIPSWFENQIDLCVDEGRCGFIEIDIPPPWEDVLGIGLCIVPNDYFITHEVTKMSNNLWISFWKPEEEFSGRLQHNPTLISCSFYGRYLFGRGAEDSIKCGWRVIRKGDFENSGRSMDQISLLPTLEQHIGAKVERGWKSLVRIWEQEDQTPLSQRWSHSPKNLYVPGLELDVTIGAFAGDFRSISSQK